MEFYKDFSIPVLSLSRCKSLVWHTGCSDRHGLVDTGKANLSSGFKKKKFGHISRLILLVCVYLNFLVEITGGAQASRPE